MSDLHAEHIQRAALRVISVTPFGQDGGGSGGGRGGGGGGEGGERECSLGAAGYGDDRTRDL